jgi:hypothetical protein
MAEWIYFLHSPADGVLIVAGPKLRPYRAGFLRGRA